MAEALEQRLRALEGRLLAREPMTFERFREAWPDMDELSRSLYETAAEVPALFPGESERIAGYLGRLGVPVSTDDSPLETILQDLESD